MKSPQSGDKLVAATGRPLVLGHLVKVRGRATPALPHVPEASIFVQVTGLESSPNISIATASSSITQHFFLLKTHKTILKESGRGTLEAPPRAPGSLCLASDASVPRAATSSRAAPWLPAPAGVPAEAAPCPKAKLPF